MVCISNTRIIFLFLIHLLYISYLFLEFCYLYIDVDMPVYKPLTRGRDPCLIKKAWGPPLVRGRRWCTCSITLIFIQVDFWQLSDGINEERKSTYLVLLLDTFLSFVYLNFMRKLFIFIFKFGLCLSLFIFLKIEPIIYQIYALFQT